ncbi:HAMP domain-containing sensor histidine kinase [Paenibacillus lautus]|uniref:sensor histidine kinase n=1 Tax=Paenibacillus TaxID=44249 RepID=UPI001C7CAABF|nr:HAMP domain-containing sensor histidine kinase [Paenibacillus lautus]MBX4149792.1 HAMP domain-containing histidine kinase [Paenibacillus lautus]
MAKRLKQTTLRVELLKYVISLTVCLVSIVLIGVFLNQLAINSGLVVNANYDERRVLEAESMIQETPQFKRELVPDEIPFVVLKKPALEVVDGSLDAAGMSSAIRAIQNRTAYQGQSVYRVVEREDAYVVLHYKVRTRFTSPFLREHFPDYEVTTIALGIVLIIGVVLAVTSVFARRLQRQFDRIQELTRSIQNQDLSLEAQRSPIKEFDDVMTSLQEMAKALEASLKAQWKTETRKREQIAALAHDIKIPVTIIKGNAELLNLDEQSEEHAGYTEYILNASNRIEHYVNMLIQLSKAEQDMAIIKKPTCLKDFIDELVQDFTGYIGHRRIELEFDVMEGLKIEQSTIYIDKALLHRALMNILTNAVDYSPNGGKIGLTLIKRDQLLSFRVTDSGPGFTLEDLEQATQLFYMGDKSRTATGHYGIGLTFASNVAKLHHGTLTLRNLQWQGGAEVTFRIPIDRSH